MNPHPDLETLAEAAEGLLETSENERILRHAENCPECADQLRSLAAVTATLASLPAPAMPAEVAARLDEALRSLQNPVNNSIVVDMSTRRRFSPGVLVGSAAACLVLLVAVAFAAGALHLPRKSGTRTADLAGGRATSILSTGQDYTTANLRAQVDVLVRQAERAESFHGSDRMSAQNTGPSTMMAPGNSPALLEACSAAIDLDVEPLAIDVAEFEGKPAAVVVVPSTQAGSVEVWIMDPACASSAVRYFTRLAVG